SGAPRDLHSFPTRRSSDLQTVRLVFGAQNVTVANPSFLSGGIELTPEFVLTYSRIAVIAFSAVVVAFVWFMLQRTPLGLNVRARSEEHTSELQSRENLVCR